MSKTHLLCPRRVILTLYRLVGRDHQMRSGAFLYVFLAVIELLANKFSSEPTRDFAQLKLSRQTHQYYLFSDGFKDVLKPFTTSALPQFFVKLSCFHYSQSSSVEWEN